ncbi:MAG TPA: hypothetical protein VJH03_00015 [Blastocatellia bacterium]|nr:hypothetical protein [Blastocatellia bacterium]
MLRDFVARLMAGEGAEVQLIEPRGLEFIAPPPLQQSLKVSEFGRVEFGPEASADAQHISFESDWIQRLGGVLGDRGRALRCVLHTDLPPLANPERILEHGLTLQNAVCRLASVTASWTRYLVLSFRYAAFSDEKRDGIVKLAVNLATSSTPDEFIPAFESAASDADAVSSLPPGVKLPAYWSKERLGALLRGALPDRILRNLHQFLRTIERRLERDSARLYDYYDGLRLESINRTRKQRTDVERERARMAVVSREYQTKVGDLEQKYALKIEVEPVQTLEIVMPVRRFEVQIKRRKNERLLLLDWNPLARKIERPPCEFGYTSDAIRVVCDEALHLLSPAAHSDCTGCGRDYCRACHPKKCPKCGRA